VVELQRTLDSIDFWQWRKNEQLAVVVEELQRMWDFSLSLSPECKKICNW
jgi:hypothetical protein